MEELLDGFSVVDAIGNKPGVDAGQRVLANADIVAGHDPNQDRSEGIGHATVIRGTGRGNGLNVIRVQANVAGAGARRYTVDVDCRSPNELLNARRQIMPLEGHAQGSLSRCGTNVSYCIGTAAVNIAQGQGAGAWHCGAVGVLRVPVSGD